MNLITIITPTNLKRERVKFFKNKNYHPVFEYDWQENKPRVKEDNPKSALIRAILDQNLKEIVDYAQIHFEIEDWQYLDLAKSITHKLPGPLLKQTISDFRNEFERSIKFLDLKEYKLKVLESQGFNFRPSPTNKKLYMSKHADFQFFDTEGEIRHELTHIIRSENSKFNKIQNSENYLPTEEGLATLMQDTARNGKTSEFQHAAEYLASHIGLFGSLRDIFNFFLAIGFNENLAWQRAARHKFGFIQTKEPGDILKPAMYFDNSQDIKKLTNQEILKLFVGKIALADLDRYNEYKGRIDKAKLVQFYNLN